MSQFYSRWNNLIRNSAIYYFSIFHPSFLFGLFWTLSDRSHGACFHSLVHSYHGLSSRFWPIESAGNSAIWHLLFHQSSSFNTCWASPTLGWPVHCGHWTALTVDTGQRPQWTVSTVSDVQCPRSSQHSKAWLPPPSPRVSVHPFVCASIFHMPTGTGACSQCSSKHGKSWLPSIYTSHSMSTPPSHAEHSKAFRLPLPPTSCRSLHLQCTAVNWRQVPRPLLLIY